MTPGGATLEEIRQVIRSAAAAGKQMKVTSMSTRGFYVVPQGRWGSGVCRGLRLSCHKASQMPQQQVLVPMQSRQLKHLSLAFLNWCVGILVSMHCKLHDSNL